MNYYSRSKIITPINPTASRTGANADNRLNLEPTKMFAASFLKVNRLHNDFLASRRILNDNIDLLTKIYRIQYNMDCPIKKNNTNNNTNNNNCNNNNYKYNGKNNGKNNNNRKIVNNNNNRKNDKNKEYSINNAYKLRKVKNIPFNTLSITRHRAQQQIEMENRWLGRRILNARTKLNHSHHRNVVRGEDDDEEDLLFNARHLPVPPRVMESYKDFINTSEQSLLMKLFRPIIYIELRAITMKYLGRITMELYTEACPELILQFVRICRNRELRNWIFPRIFNELWIEGELLVDRQILHTPGFPHTLDCIDHSVGPGVMSFSQDFLYGFPAGHLNFTISLKPLATLRDKRLPFGRVVKGLKVLESLQAFGSKNGRIRQNFEIIDSGVLN